MPTLLQRIDRLIYYSPLYWEAVRQLECMGFKVIAITAAGASMN